MAKVPEMYCLKLFNNGKFSIMAWTPIVAKKGYAVLTTEQAKPYLRLAQGGKNHIDNVKNKDFIKSIKKVFEVSGKAGRALEEKVKALEEDSASNVDDIVKDVVSNKVKNQTVNDDEVRELSVSQESIQVQELKFIKGLQHKSTLESHMLEKYQCSIEQCRLV